MALVSDYQSVRTRICSVRASQSDREALEIVGQLRCDTSGTMFGRLLLPNRPELLTCIACGGTLVTHRGTSDAGSACKFLQSLERMLSPRD